MFRRDVSKPSCHGFWGLYCGQTYDPVPLKSLNASVQILNNIAKVFFTQVYFNKSNTLLESEFFFPVASGVCFDSFEAKYNNTTIKGIVKLKDVAKEEYKEAVSEGRMAAYSEVVEETGDIMKVMICNIPPNTDVSITYSYIEKLEMVMNKFWCFRLFSTLTPRYNGNMYELLKRDVNILSNYPTIHPKSKDAYPWNIEVNVQTSSPLTLLRSPSHNIQTSYGNENHTCLVTLDSVSKNKPNKDFVILFSNNDIDKVDYMLTPFEEGYCAMVNVSADFNEQTDDTLYAKLEKAKWQSDIEEDAPNMNSVRGEYIFLIDRSGSMDGNRINMARNALQLFIKSLPKDSFFNIVSFGSSYNLMNKNSVKSEPKTLDSTIKKVKTFGADMGGTEIFSALQNVFNQPLKKRYPRFVFLLTDGAVSNTQHVLQLIKSNSTTSQTFTIGIGNGCSPELITKGATYGRGKHEFVADNDNMYEKVIGLLNASLSPCYSDFSLEAPNFDAIVQGVSPNPASVPFLLKGQHTTFYLFLRKEAFENQNGELKLTVKMHDSRTQKQRSVDAILNISQSIENDMVAKLGINDMITRLEEQKKDTSKENMLLWYDKNECKKALTDLSLKYGILTSETAFICEVSDNSDVTDGIPKKKIIVPTIESHDYVQPSFEGGMFKCLAAPSGNVMRRSAGTGPRAMKKSVVNIPGSSLLGSLTSGISNLVSSVTSFGGKSSSKPQSASKNYKLSSQAYTASTSTADSKCMTLSTASVNTNSFNLPPSSSTPQYSTSTSSSMAGEENRPGQAFRQERFRSIAMPVPEDQRKRVEANLCSLNAGFSQRINKPPMMAKKEEEKMKVTTKGSKSSYLDVIMQQSYEGSWNASDANVKQSVLKSKANLNVPDEIKKTAGKLAETVWITVLVLLWLEVVFVNERKAWALVYQKGCDWLKENGIEYEKVKELGRVAINC